MATDRMFTANLQEVLKDHNLVMVLCVIYPQKAKSGESHKLIRPLNINRHKPTTHKYTVDTTGCNKINLTLQNTRWVKTNDDSPTCTFIVQ